MATKSKTIPAIDSVQAAQEAARLAKFAKLEVAMEAAVRLVHDQEGKREDTVTEAYQLIDKADDLVADKTEAAYKALAKLAHDNDLSHAQAHELLVTVMKKDTLYGNSATANVGSTAKLRTLLSRAMHPLVHANIEAVIAPWRKAWIDEGAALKADKSAPRPIRAKFTSRQNLYSTALREAIGVPEVLDDNGKIKNAKLAVKPHVPKSTKAVLTWVAEHPRVKRTTGGKTSTTPPANDAGKNADGTPMTERQYAEQKVAAVVSNVRDLAKAYPAAGELFKAVIAALAHCTSDRMVPGRAAPSAAAGEPSWPNDKPAHEPVTGAADIDDAMANPIAALIAQNNALMAMLAKGK